MRDAAFPAVLIALGIAWLAFSLNWVPDTDWLIVAVLAGMGAAILVIEGITKRSIVTGPLLIAAGGAWMLRMLAGTRWPILLPALMILAGVLMLIARLPGIPERARQRGRRAGAEPAAEAGKGGPAAPPQGDDGPV